MSEKDSKVKDKDTSEDDNDTVKTYTVFKYSTNISLAEQILLDGKSVFLQIINGLPVISECIDLSEEKGIILYPIETGVISPIRQFEYKNEEEIIQIIQDAQSKTIDDLYFKSKSIWKRLTVTDEDQIVLFTADSIFTFFQDRFATTHYIMIIGPPGSGKGASLGTFKFLGYRVVMAANMSGANIIDLLGSVELGQVTIAEDELDNIDKDNDKRRLYKVGYDILGLTTKTLDGNTSKRQLRYYLAFCYKIFGAKRSLDSDEMSGFNDRTFAIKSLKGKPEFYVKTFALSKMPKRYCEMLLEIDYFRKLMLVYRLLHANDIIDNVKTNIDTRALELAGPEIDLFSADSFSKDKLAIKEILPVLSSFLKEKGEISENTLENIIYKVIKERCEQDKSNEENIVVSNHDIIEDVRIKSDGRIIPLQQAFYSPLFDKVTHKKIFGRCRDIFRAKDDSLGIEKEKQRALRFNKNFIQRLQSTFDTVAEIKILDNGDNDNDAVVDSNPESGTKGQEKADTEDKEGFEARIVTEIKAESIDKFQEKIENNVNINTDLFLNTDLISSQGLISVSSSRIQQTLGNYVAFDLEWNSIGEITAAAFVDSNDKSEVYLKEDFITSDNSEAELLGNILNKLIDYETSIGWYTTGTIKYQDGVDSDLINLHNRCIENGLESIVDFRRNNQPFIPGLIHIDLHQVFDKKIIKEAIYKNGYRTLKLNAVCKYILKEGKYKNLTGAQFNSLSIEEKRNYVLKDAELVMKLSKHENFKILDIMFAISEL